MTDFRVIETPEAYEDAVSLLAAGEGPIAVDAERASGFRYSQRAYLIQMFRRGAGTFLFDPTTIPDFSRLEAEIGDDEWVLHAASQDLACLREVGLDPARIFDTELAARLLGMARVGLASVVEELLGVKLAKEHSAADWSTRPLPDSWLTYAALDVELLVDVRDALTERLEAAGKQGLAAEEFGAVLTKEAKPPAAEPWRRLSGIHAIRHGRNLAVARSLWLTRDARASELDVAPGRLVPDASLVAAARILPRTKRALADLKEFSGRASRSELDRWWAAIEAGLADPEPPAVRVPNDAPPPPRAWAARHPEADARLRLAKAAVTEVAEQLQMPTENLLTPDTLRRVAWQPPADASPAGIGDALRAHGAREWQIDATAQRIAEAFVEAAQSLEDASASDS
ncbi:HRDC domain-containing protein [Agromyces aerolatus]|uniref:HRDC domain-containing protein n=1 Tax=Agromyces sp. LY-1074 TaxID=3074080 RepID=UPI00285900DD|nr:MULTISPECIES: HRDC domain-containing protein [unclassified Agromyces]MDR5700414.1 HRDC domain-containing protein [Agromyces sp. LY-1074]MDR5706608.1 HRDC domain-containing protein [Agromyces sp. LY-1358]